MSSCAYVFTRGAACRLHFAIEIVGGATGYDGPGDIFEHTCAYAQRVLYIAFCLSVCPSLDHNSLDENSEYSANNSMIAIIHLPPKKSWPFHLQI